MLYAVVAGALIFSMAEAAYLWARTRKERRELRLRVRLGMHDPMQPLLRAQTGWTARAAERLDAAGLDWSPAGWIARAMFAGLFLGAMGLLGAGPGGAVIGALAGPALVHFWILHKRRLRLDRVNAQLPHALELMLLGLRAGHALPRAVELAADEVAAPAGAELRRVVDEHALGRPLEQAFSGLARRLEGSDAVRTLVTGVLVLRQTGGNLIEVIERILDTLQSQEQYRLKLRSLTAESRSSGFILSVLPAAFALLAALADTSYMRLFVTEPSGQTLGMVALVMWLAGVVWMRRMLRPEA